MANNINLINTYKNSKAANYNATSLTAKGKYTESHQKYDDT